MLVGIGLGKFDGIGRGIHNPHVHSASFVLQRASVRSGNAHHVAKGSEHHIVIGGDGEAVIDSAHRQHANRTARAVN